jgi:ABC-2 type transport system permease protein
MKQLIKTEFKRNLRSLILWSSIVAGMAALMLLLYPAFKDAFSQMEEFLSIYPEEFLEAFGMGEGGLNMSDFYGWFGVEGYLFVNLIGGSYAAILGGSILSKEEDDKTIEFLLSKPISRDHILYGKGLVVAINLLLKYITPYEYINAVTIVNEETIKPLYLLISVLIIGVSFVSAWFFYRKKDITA